MSHALPSTSTRLCPLRPHVHVLRHPMVHATFIVFHAQVSHDVYLVQANFKTLDFPPVPPNHSYDVARCTRCRVNAAGAAEASGLQRRMQLLRFRPLVGPVVSAKSLMTRKSHVKRPRRTIVQSTCFSCPVVSPITDRMVHSAILTRSSRDTQHHLRALSRGQASRNAP